MGRALRTLAIVWLIVFWWAMLLFGTWQPPSFVAAAAIALAAAVAAAAVERAVPLELGLRLRWLRLLWSVPHRTFVDFAILVRELCRALATGRRPEGVFRAKEFDAARSPGWRAFVGAAAGYTPNAYVVELDPERGQVLVHDLVASERSEAPA